MNLLTEALRAGLRPSTATAAAGHLVVAGAAGPLGSAVLEQVLGRRRWQAVSALVTQPIEVALAGLQAVRVDADRLDGSAPGLHADSAIVVFDRERSLHGREAAFLCPEPAQLPMLAQWLQRAGVRRLVVVMPHAPALLPQALKAGLASLDEQAVAALGFEHLVIVRSARAAGEATPGPESGPPSGLHRLGAALLSQLSWMVPQRDQPLRAAKVAQFVAALAQDLVEARPGTRVAPPELLHDWAQPEGGAPVLQAWLRHGRWAAPTAAQRRW